MSNDYSYDDYLESGEVSPPPEIAPVVETPTNEYTGGEYDLGEQLSKSISKEGVGVDLNDGTDSVTGTAAKSMAKDDVGEDLNDAGTERMDAALENFQGDKWSELSLEDQKRSMTDLADYVAADTGNKNPPEIVFRDDMEDGMYGGYSPDTNTIEINQNMLDDSNEAADTITHEMWHAYQQQCAADPNNERSQEYQEAFDNYISPEYDFEGYENQMVESEAREYAQGFKDRLAGIQGA